MSNFNGISVIIPCHDERDSIAAPLGRTRAVPDTMVGLADVVICGNSKK